MRRVGRQVHTLLKDVIIRRWSGKSKNVIQFYYTVDTYTYIAAKFAVRRKGVGVVFLPSKSSMHFTTPLTEYKSDLDTCPSIAMFQITFEKERKWKWINRERIKPLYLKAPSKRPSSYFEEESSDKIRYSDERFKVLLR